MDEELSGKDKRNIAIQASIEAIPYVGSSLSTIYFGTKQEKRFKRIKRFYKEIKDEIEDIKEKIADINEYDHQELSAIMEELHDKIESEHLEVKIKYYKEYFKSTLINPVNNNYEERKLFLDILSDLTPIQITLIKIFLKSNQLITSKYIGIGNVPQSIILGSINRLKNYGLVNTDVGNITFSSSGGNINERVRISNFGRRFHKFCIKEI